MVIKKYEGVEAMTNWADELIPEYKEGRKGLIDMGRALKLYNDRIAGDKEWDELDVDSRALIEMNEQDKKQINSMVSDMSFSIDWMKKGRRPGNLRGVDRRSAYQRRALIDMDLMPSLDIQPQVKEISEEMKEILVNVLVDLSHRERQCYLLHMSQGWSLSEIAKELKVARGTVQQYVDRAKDKITLKVL